MIGRILTATALSLLATSAFAGGAGTEVYVYDQPPHEVAKVLNGQLDTGGFTGGVGQTQGAVIYSGGYSDRAYFPGPACCSGRWWSPAHMSVRARADRSLRKSAR